MAQFSNVAQLPDVSLAQRVVSFSAFPVIAAVRASAIGVVLLAICGAAREVSDTKKP
jgi:hypothetical protein